MTARYVVAQGVLRLHALHSSGHVQHKQGYASILCSCLSLRISAVPPACILLDHVHSSRSGTLRPL